MQCLRYQLHSILWYIFSPAAIIRNPIIQFNCAQSTNISSLAHNIFYNRELIEKLPSNGLCVLLLFSVECISSGKWWALTRQALSSASLCVAEITSINQTEMQTKFKPQQMRSLSLSLMSFKQTNWTEIEQTVNEKEEDRKKIKMYKSK